MKYSTIQTRHPRRLASLYVAIALGLALPLGSAPARAMEVGSTRFEDHVRVGGSDLTANGGGIRSKLFIKVYAMTLYLPEKQNGEEGVLAAKGPKRIAITLLRDLSGEQFAEALVSGMEKNHTEAELGPLRSRLTGFAQTLQKLGEAKSGATVYLDWLPESGTRLSVAGEARGADIPGEDFYRALLRIWLGNNPIQDNLKAALLGKPQ